MKGILTYYLQIHEITSSSGCVIHLNVLLSQIVTTFGLLIFLSLLISAITLRSDIYIPHSRQHKLSLFKKSKSFWRHYLQSIPSFHSTANNSESSSFNIPFLIATLINFSLLIFFPMNRQFTGIKTDYSYLVVALFILLNFIIFLMDSSSQKGITVEFYRDNREFFSTILIIITAASSVSLSLHTMSVHKIIQYQQERLFYFLPAWGSLRSLPLFLNSIVFLAYLILIIQQFNATDRHPHLFKSLWKFSYLVLLIMIYMYLFWGAYLSPFSSGFEPVSTIVSIFWLILKVIVILLLIRYIYRRIPRLVEEQFLKITYTFVFPFQILSTFLLILQTLN